MIAANQRLVRKTFDEMSGIAELVSEEVPVSVVLVVASAALEELVVGVSSSVVVTVTLEGNSIAPLSHTPSCPLTEFAKSLLLYEAATDLRFNPGYPSRG